MKLRNCDPVRVQDIIIGEFRPGIVTSDQITSRLDKYFFMKIVGETQSSSLQVKQIESRDFSMKLRLRVCPSVIDVKSFL